MKRTYTMEARADAVEATRRRIVDTAQELFFGQWYDEVTLSAIAAAAGVSHQTVLNHFGSKDGVLAAVVEKVHVETAERRSDFEPGDTTAAIDRLLEQYEESGLANYRASCEEHRVPALHTALGHARSWHRAWVERTFADALPASGPARRQRVAAFVAATEVAAWKALRHDYGFSRRDTSAAIHTLIRTLEAQP